MRFARARAKCPGSNRKSREADSLQARTRLGAEDRARTIRVCRKVLLIEHRLRHATASTCREEWRGHKSEDQKI